MPLLLWQKNRIIQKTEFMSENLIKDLIIEKLQTVYDPEVPVNIWDLGLVYDIEFPKPSEVVIHMTLTAPGCPIADEIVQQVHDVVMEVDGILLDLGVSSHQLDTPQRGFSYREDAPLDMRMDPSAPLSAYDVVNGYPAETLARILKEYGEERYASRIANAIVQRRAEAPLNSTMELAELVKRALPAPARREAQHPARRTFQALRIEVNGELAGLAEALTDAHDLLRPGGVLAVITFHSLEDRIVKQLFRTFEHPCTCDPHAPVCTCGKKPTVRALTKKPIMADETELEANPRAHSAKLRAIEKL